MTNQLLELGDWLADEGVTHVAMESTGVYWKPIWNLLEEQFEIHVEDADVEKLLTVGDVVTYLQKHPAKKDAAVKS